MADDKPTAQPIIFHCACGQPLHPYVIAGPLYHEYVVALDTEANFVRHYVPPTGDDLPLEAYQEWWEIYSGDLVYASSYAVVEQWMGQWAGSPPPLVHDLVNSDGTRRYTAPPHERMDP